MDREKVISKLTADELIEELDYCGYDPYYDSLRKPIVDEIRRRLKEQEAKPVVDIIDSVDGIEVGNCPSCDRLIVNKKSDPTQYCKFCGQAVKWK